ncbi:MAG: tRNA pseudouridine synthase A, partial [Candidatus Eisenbacteria bacterium]
LEERVEIAGAGRTDAGVHARGQCASFTTARSLPTRALVPKLRRLLPGDVRALHAEERAPGFHARHDARARRYAYRLLHGDDVLRARYAWAPRGGWAPEPLERAVRPLEGEHDCTSFASAGSPASTPVCRIHRARWSRWEGGVQLDIIADHFLYHMVRAIVGTALEAARAAHPEREMTRVIGARDRTLAGRTVPPQGLSLEQVFYPQAEESR